jgi:hypothetical protein
MKRGNETAGRGTVIIFSLLFKLSDISALPQSTVAVRACSGFGLRASATECRFLCGDARASWLQALHTSRYKMGHRLLESGQSTRPFHPLLVFNPSHAVQTRLFSGGHRRDVRSCGTCGEWRECRLYLSTLLVHLCVSARADSCLDLDGSCQAGHGPHLHLHRRQLQRRLHQLRRPDHAVLQLPARVPERHLVRRAGRRSVLHSIRVRARRDWLPSGIGSLMLVRPQGSELPFFQLLVLGDGARVLRSELRRRRVRERQVQERRLLLQLSASALRQTVRSPCAAAGVRADSNPASNSGAHAMRTMSMRAHVIAVRDRQFSSRMHAHIFS